MVRVVQATRDAWREEAGDGYAIHYRNRSMRKFKIAIWPIAILVGLFPLGVLLTVMAWATRDEAGAEGIFTTLLSISIFLTGLVIFLAYWIFKESEAHLKITHAGIQVDDRLFPLKDIKSVSWSSQGYFKPFAGWIDLEFGDRKIPIITGLHSDATERVHDLIVESMHEIGVWKSTV